MADSDTQIVSDDNGQPTAATIPIAVWREIESERETAYLLQSYRLKSRNMKARLTSGLRRDEGISIEAVIAEPGV